MHPREQQPAPQPVRPVREVEHCWVTMADGVRLSARLWLPHSLPAPAIVEYIPYRKRDLVRGRDERNHAWFAARGYACARVDMRGSGDSQGAMADMYQRAELDDALNVLDWVAKREWCDGAVGMFGTSWGGTSALQAAAAGSGLLKAALAVCATDDRYADDIHHMGGCLLTDCIEWGAALPAILALPPGAESDPANWRETWRARLEQMQFPLFSWVEHETRDAYWRHGSVAQTPGAFDCPVLLMGGWSDRYSNTVMNTLAANPRNCWGIVGPWGHHYPDQGVPGPALDFRQEALRWWERWLRGRDNGVERAPRLRVWRNQFQPPADFLAKRRGRWFEVADWAVAAKGATEREFHFAPAATVAAPNPAADFARIPNDLRVGGAAGDTGYFGRPGGLPIDQSADDARSLCFDSAPLGVGCFLLGQAVARLALTVDKLPAQVVLRLGDVAPDGRAQRVAYRVCNLALDDAGRPLAPAARGRIRHLELALPNAAHWFAAGHRIRLALSASYWPMIWPAPHCADLAVDRRQVILHLALAPAEARPAAPSALAQARAPADRDRAARATIHRETQFDAATGDLVYRWRHAPALARHAAVDITIGAETSAEHRINVNRPQSAQSCYTHRIVAVHGRRRFESEGQARARAGRDHYLIDGGLAVSENGREAFCRNWSRKIAKRYA